MSGSLGELVVKISADHAKFVSDMGKIQKSAQDSANRMSSALNSVHGSIVKIGTVLTAVAAGAGFAKLIQSAVEWNLSAAKTARMMGTTTEQASIMNVALYRLGIGTEVAQNASLRLSKVLATGTDKFDKWGVKVKDASGNLLPMPQIMANVNQKILEMQKGTNANIVAMDLYGRGWKDMSGILRLTAEEMESAEETARRLHLIVGPEGVEKSREYQKNLRDIELVGKSLSVQIGNELLPVVTQLAAFMGGPAITAVGMFGTAMRDGVRNIADYATEVEYALKKMMLAVSTTKDNAGKSFLSGLAQGALNTIPGLGTFANVGGNMSFSEAQRQYLFNKLEADKQKELLDHARTLGSSVKPVRVSPGGLTVNPNTTGKNGKKAATKVEDLPSAYAMLVKDAKAFAAAWEKDQKKLREDAEWISEQRNAYAEAVAKALKDEHELSAAGLEHKLTLVDTAEAFRDISRAEAAEQRLALTRQMVEEQARWVDITGQGVEKLDELNARVREAQAAALEASSNMAAGGLAGITAYVDELPSQFEFVRDSVKNDFREMEDAIVDFVKTGKLNFSSLVDSIISDLARIVVRQTITAPLASGLSSAISGWFGGGVNIDTWGGLPGGLLGSYATGTNYVPETGPYLLHKGEAVVPSGQNGGLTINVPVSVSGNNALASDLRNEIERTVIDVVRRHS